MVTLVTNKIRKVEKTKQNVDSSGTIKYLHSKPAAPSISFELLRLRIKRFFSENWEKRKTKTSKVHRDLQRFYQRVHH